MDVWVVFWVYVFEFWMECGIACAGQTGKSLVDLDERIADMEVGVVVISWQPAGGRVGNFVGLGREALTLDKAAEGFCVVEVLCA